MNQTYVSLQLGNRIEVCLEFYTGYELHDENITVLKSLILAKKIATGTRNTTLILELSILFR